MGLFRKKNDPLAQRADSLNRRIAELEAEISKLNQTITPDAARPAAPPKGETRSTPAAPSSRPAPAQDPVFERMPARPAEGRRPEPAGQAAVDMGLKRPVWSQLWKRVKGRWVDPPPANEKLVSYLAAGGIQGLRPLRYERRVARNRLIFVCVVLGLLLWGLLVVFWQAR